MSVRYIGSKARIADAIVALVGKPYRNKGVFVDAFCGTGVVAEAAARSGWQIRLNDHLQSAVTMSHARLVSQDDAHFHAVGGYVNAIEKLNASKPHRGFLWREYSPVSEKHTGIARMYFTEANAARIDGIRKLIGEWSASNKLTQTQERLLIADLLLATNRVANIAGTYGCFLSHWSNQARGTLFLKPRNLFPRRVDVKTSTTDVRNVKVSPEDVVYCDPPYTKRQYAAYYHILETITVGDSPIVEGVTGLRPWRSKASDFCYRTRALKAIIELVDSMVARRVLLSSSSQGHVELSPLADALSKIGKLSVIPLKEIGRYRPNRAACNAGSAVTEYLLVIERSTKSIRQLEYA